MKFYRVTGQREYSEQPAADCKTGEAVTITERRAVMDISDYITIYRCEIVSESAQFTGFQFLTMPDGYSLSIYVCDYSTGAKVIADNLDALLSGDMSGASLDVILNRLQQEYLQS